MADDDVIVDDCEFSDDTVLKVTDRLGVNVTVTARDIANVSISVRKGDKISDVINKFQRSIEYDEVSYMKKSLNCNKTVGHYNLKDNCVIKAVSRLRNMIQLNIRKYDGCIVPIEVAQNDRIFDLKRIIQEKVRLRPDEQELTYNDTLLEDNNRVDYYKLSKKRIIDVVNVQQSMKQLFVKTMDGRTTTIEVANCTLISECKKIIQEKMGLWPLLYRLVCYGHLLDDSRSIRYYEIPEKSVINAVDITRRGITIFARTMDGLEVPFELAYNSSVSYLKKKIREKMGLAEDEHSLLYRGQILKEDKRIQYYKINKNAVVNIETKLKVIFAKTEDRKVYDIGVNIYDSMYSVKEKICAKIGIPPCDQTLMYQGEILEDGKIIQYYHIISNSAILVDAEFEPIEIIVKVKLGTSIVLSVRSNYKMIDIKKMIESKIGLESERQLLKISGKMVDDDYWTVQEYGIDSDSDMEVCEVMKVNLTIMWHNTIKISVLTSETIIDLKRKIQEKTGVPYYDQVLEKVSDDDRSREVRSSDDSTDSDSDSDSHHRLSSSIFQNIDQVDDDDLP